METTVRALPYLVSWAALAILVIIGMDRMPLVLYTPIDGQWAKWNVEAILQFGKVFDLSAHSMLAGMGSMYFDLLEIDGHELAGKAIELRKAELARLLRDAGPGLQLCAHLDQPGDVVFAHACQLGSEGIVSKRLGSRYRCPDWIKVKNPASPAVRREAEEDWSKRR